MTKSPAQLDREIEEAFGTDAHRTRAHRAADTRSPPERKLDFIQTELEPLGFVVTIKNRSKDGGHVRIEHAPSRFYETFGVSKYGIVPGEVSLTSPTKPLGTKLSAIINKARKLK